MKLRRGFKTEANEIAREIRAELKLSPPAPLSSWRLAEYLEIEVIPLAEMKSCASRAFEYFSHVDMSAFSAVTVFHGIRRVIVYNDSHLRGRQASNLSHELAHAILLHPPTPALDDMGCRIWNQEIEDEAAYLGAALLVTEEAALSVVHQGISNSDAANYYGVGLSLMQMRINLTGARKRVERMRRR